MKIRKRVPKIRFTGEPEAWQWRKFGDVFAEYQERNDGTLQHLSLKRDVGTYPSEPERAPKDLNACKRVNEGDFILHLQTSQSGLTMASQTGCVSSSFNIYHGEATDSSFYSQYFKSERFIRSLNPYIQGFREQVSAEGLQQVAIPCAEIETQQQIGAFFKTFDHLQSLMMRKGELLQKYKKASLQKMFPND